MRKRFQMGRRGSVEIYNRLFMALKLPSSQRSLVYEAISDAQVSGIRLAASVAADYDRQSLHPYLVSDCILGKLNVLKGRPKKNAHSKGIDIVLTNLERKVDSLYATSRFMARAAKRKLARE